MIPEIEQDVCLVYLSNEKIEKAYIKYTTLENAESAKPTFESVIMRNKPLKKWSNCILNDTETDELMRLSDMFAKIGSFGDISPGIVTGANSFFILSKQDIDKLNLNVKHQLSIISKGSLIPSLLTFKPEDFMFLSGTKNRTRLLDLTGLKETEFSNELKAYLLSGEKKDIHNRYKCKKRHRWYDVPIVKKGDVCFFKRFHYLPKIIINSADIHTTENMYDTPQYASLKRFVNEAFDKYTSLQLGARKKKERKVKEEGQLALAGAKKAVAVFADQINTLKKAVSDTSSTTTPEQQAAHLAEVEAHVSKVFSTAEESLEKIKFAYNYYKKQNDFRSRETQIYRNIATLGISAAMFLICEILADAFGHGDAASF